MKKLFISGLLLFFLVSSIFSTSGRAIATSSPIKTIGPAQNTETSEPFSFEERLQISDPAALFELSEILRSEAERGDISKFRDANALLIYSAYKKYLPAVERMEKYILEKEKRTNTITIGEREAWLIIAKDFGSKSAIEKLKQIKIHEKKQQSIDLALKQIRYFMQKDKLPPDWEKHL